MRLLSKIQQVTVTEANLLYEGSITISKDILDAAGLTAFDMVHVNSLTTGAHWETYIIEGKDGEVCLNGAAARHFDRGDEIHILHYGEAPKGSSPVIVHCDRSNRVVRVVK
jgi:aspartate 1-decarboxylase